MVTFSFFCETTHNNNKHYKYSPHNHKMSNSSHAYNDYNGPRLPGVKMSDKVPVEDIDDETNPCVTFSWMEGDSLAPPCGSSISLIHDMLEFASVHQDDVLYDVSLEL